MDDDTVKTCWGYTIAGVICCFALAVDGVNAQTLAIGVAGLMCGATGYAAGTIRERYRRLRSP